MLIVCVSIIYGYSQGQIIHFEKTVHDFSNIKEADGAVSCEFAYENSSKKMDAFLTHIPNAPQSVKFAWSRDLLPPQGKDVIKITFDPKGINGNFSYSFDVIFREKDKDVTYPLTIKGNVTPRPKTAQELYPMKEGNLRYKSNYVRYENAHPNLVKQDTFFFYNEWDRNMKFTYSPPPRPVESIEFLYLTPELKPMEGGFLVFKFNAGKENEWGTFMEKIIIQSTDSLRPTKTFYISGEKFDDFGSWTTEQKENAPKIEVLSPDYNFQTIKAGEKVEHVYVVKNIGKSPLILRKLKSSCSCTATQPDKTELQPNEETTIKAIFNTHGKQGQQTRTIDIISNDPTRPKLTLKIIGNLN
ncbi:MAG: DUF1573 domain-containing protein [Bacteroidales bacterium]|nr:DUF1573 domain-containing protein [Bacteroidales bacterium]